MPIKEDVQLLLTRARLFLEEGQYDLALSVLESVEVLDVEQEQQKAYLFGWYYTARKRWSEAAQCLLPLQKSSFIVEYENQESTTTSVRQAIYLLQLGNVAVNLCRYEDASRHFLQCLKVIEKKRLNLPTVQLKARYGLGMTCIMLGMFGEALQHYREALALIGGDESNEDLPDIYYGLCDAYRGIGNFESAYEYGKKALGIYEKRKNHPLAGRVRTLLARISFHEGHMQTAQEHYTEALGIATIYNNQALAMVSFTGMADLLLAEQRFEDARRYCQLASEIVQRTNDAHVIGMLYLVTGKVAQVEAQQAKDARQQRLLEEAITCFEKAKKYLSSTQARTLLAELYGRWAQALEQLKLHHEAIRCWKLAYRALSKYSDNGDEI